MYNLAENDFLLKCSLIMADLIKYGRKHTQIMLSTNLRRYVREIRMQIEALTLFKTSYEIRSKPRFLIFVYDLCAIVISAVYEYSLCST